MKRVKEKLMAGIMAVCLMFVMVLSTGMPVSALSLTPTATDNITISGIETDEDGNGIGILNAYKIINVNVDGNQPKAPTYTWDTSVAEWVDSNFENYIDMEDSKAVTKEFLNLSDSTSSNNNEALKTFVDRLANAIRDENSTIQITPTSTNLSDYNSSEITISKGLGAYLFLIEGGVRIYSPGFAAVYPVNEDGTWVTEGHSVDVALKSTEPGIEKTVSDYTYEIGQTVTYTLTVDVPDYPDNAIDKKFIIADYLSEGLTLDSNSIKIYLFDKDAVGNKGTEITSSFTDYTFGTNHPAEGGTPSFAKSFNADYSILTSDKVIVTYSAKVNEKAVVKETEETDNKLNNKAYLVYSNNPYTEDGYKEKPDEERVYTYGIEVTKTGDANAKLPGAEFTLKPEDGNTMSFIKVANGVYRRPSATDSTSQTTTLVTNSQGKITISGLDLGTYILTETKAPEGYELPTNPDTTITLEDTADQGTGKPDGILNNDSDGTFETTVVNTKPGILPKTGGIGTAVFTVCGICLMAGAVLLMATVARRKNR